MSFLQAGRAIQRFIIDKKYNTPEQEMIRAVLAARQFNSTIVETNADPAFEYGPGKLRPLKISYYPIRCDVVAESIPTNICEAGVVAEPKQEWFSIADFTASSPQKLNVSDIKLVDGNYTVSQHAMAQINSTLGALEVALSKQITTKIIAHKGLHLDGTEFGTRVTMNQTTNGLITPLGYWQVEKEQNDAAFSQPFIIGSTEVFYWRKAFAMAATNTTLGQDFTKAGIDRLYYDVNLNSIMSVDAGDPEYILTFDPEALKFVSFSNNAGMFATDMMGPQDFDRAYSSGGLYSIRGVFMSPKYGLKWDFFAKFNDCDGLYGSWSWFLLLTWDIVFPTIQACNIQGVNGIMMYKTCPVVIPVCPSGDTPSPAVSPTTFSWTPPGVYPLLISDITIGGVTSYPATNVANITQLVAALNAAAQENVTFTVSGSNVHYTGYSAITGSINAGNITITFA